MAESFLGEPLRIAARFGPLCPRMPVAVQVHSRHGSNAAAPAKLGRPGVVSAPLDRREQIACFGKGEQDLAKLLPDGEPCRFAQVSQLLASVNEDASAPIDLGRGHIRGVGWGGSRLIKEFIIGSPLGVLLAGNDGCVFLRTDGALALAANLRPCGLVEDRPRQPAEIECEVVEAAQVLANGIAAGVTC